MNNTKKVVFIGGKQIGVNCLRVILNNGIRPDLLIPNMDDESVSESWHESINFVAKEAGLNIYKNKLKDSETVTMIRNIRPEIIFCIGSNQIVPEEIINIPKEGVINIHPALLPKYRGRFSTAHVLFNGEKKTGVTLHYIDKGMDTGPILFQKEYQISDTDTAKDVYDNFTKVGTNLFVKFVNKWVKGDKLLSYKQNEKEASVCKGLPNDGKIDWKWSGEQINRFIRSMTFEPFPPTSFKIGDKNMVIVEEKYFNKFK